MMEKAIVKKINDNSVSLQDFYDALSVSENDLLKRLILDYPTVYIHNAKTSGKYDVYIGESNDIIQRTRQHHEQAKISGSWQYELINQEGSSLYVIAHPHFNKSLTLDVENRLMQYLSSVDTVDHVYNKRGNEQYEYYPSSEMKSIFNQIWKELGKYDNKLFPDKEIVESAAIFKASPFHKLTQEQRTDKQKIINIIEYALNKNTVGQLVMVVGEAGTGKTVLNSNIFYELCVAEKDDHPMYNCHLLVNHDEQLKVYQQIVSRLGLKSVEQDFVSKPTRFINSHNPDKPVDIIFVDEAHLLWTQGKQSYRGENQLDDLLKLARVVVTMFDPKQVLHTQSYIEPGKLEYYASRALKNDCYMSLVNQLRICGNEQTVKWIRDFVDHHTVTKIPYDENYQLIIADSPLQLEKMIREKASSDATPLSRVLATFDWDYIDKKKPGNEDYWMVRVGDWKMPWNLQLPLEEGAKKAIRNLPWAEQPQTINEVGSTFTIQGFDLHYAGVILGPSVKYRNGRIIYDPSECADKKAVQNRTLSDGTKAKFGEEMIRNQVNVLMTRGVNGLFIFAVDKELQEALKRASGE